MDAPIWIATAAVCIGALTLVAGQLNRRRTDDSDYVAKLERRVEMQDGDLGRKDERIHSLESELENCERSRFRLMQKLLGNGNGNGGKREAT